MSQMNKLDQRQQLMVELPKYIFVFFVRTSILCVIVVYLIYPMIPCIAQLR